MNTPTPKTDSVAWKAQVWIAFVLSFFLTVGGMLVLPIDMWMRGYILMGFFFTVVATLSLSKTLRDSHESQLYHKKLQAAKHHHLLKEFEKSEI